MKMFNLIKIGERAGSGVPDIFSVWKNEGWGEPRVGKLERNMGQEYLRIHIMVKNILNIDFVREIVYNYGKLTRHLDVTHNKGLKDSNNSFMFNIRMLHR